MDHSNLGSYSDSPDRKPLGRYLLEAGLLSPSQLRAALQQQQYTRQALGEILVLRGWIKQSVINLVVETLQVSPEENELRVVIRPGKKIAAQGVIKNSGQNSIVNKDDSPSKLLEEDTDVCSIEDDEIASS